eukprot:SAG31_NODE_1821_length_7194_cov_11.104863_8_plen_46_part_00
MYLGSLKIYYLYMTDVYIDNRTYRTKLSNSKFNCGKTQYLNLGTA